MILPQTFKEKYNYYYSLTTLDKISLDKISGVYLLVKAYYKDENCEKHLSNDPDLETSIWEFWDKEKAENYYKKMTEQKE